jgi:hypothetical protein
VRRRIRFAAPFVMITTASCGQPAPATLPTESPIVASAPDIDAAEPEEIDAAPPIDAAIDAAIPASHLVTIALPERTLLHKLPPCPRGYSCNPPPPVHRPAEHVTTPMLDISGYGDGTLIVVAQQHDEETKNDEIARGMIVTAKTPAMKSRVKVGHVRETSATSATLYIRLSLDEVENGAELVIDAAKSESVPPVIPLTRRIIAAEVGGDFTVITVDAGTNDGIDRDWHVDVLDGRGKRMPGGDATIVKVTANVTVAKVKLTIDQVKSSRRQVRLSPPEFK